MAKKIYERPLIKPINTVMPGKSGTEAYLFPLSDIEGVPVKKLVKSYGSPLFVFSERKIRENICHAKRSFSTRYPKVKFAWSYKTNYLDAICRIFHQEGSWAEVVSGLEYEKAIRNGVSPDKILFNGPDKSRTDLLRAAENGSFIHIDNLDELYLLSEIADEKEIKPKVAIRVNMDTGIQPMWDRFGFNYENGQAWDAICKIVRSGKLDLKGLHCHIGTFILSVQAYTIAAEKMALLACNIQQKLGCSVDYIDMGGGFASKNTLKTSYLGGTDICPNMDDYAEAITSAFFKAPFKENNLPVLVLETGRALIDDAGYLFTTVLTNKRSASNKRYTIIDAGVNILFTAFWYDHKISPAQSFSSYFENTTLYGPLCMNIDMVRDYVSLPLLNKGDVLVVHNVGAYNVSQWSQFITERPNVVLIGKEGVVSIIREKESLDIVKQQERVPDYLL